MNDYISKSSVCEILSDLYPMDGEKVVSVKAIDKAYEEILQLQSVQSKQLTEVQDILQFLDEHLHPIVSPEHWNIYSELHDMISCLSSVQSEQQWIPCSEKLPDEKRETYWVCTDTEYQCQCRWTNNRFGIRESDEWGWSIFDTPQYTKVVAWRPLPEAYKESEE